MFLVKDMATGEDYALKRLLIQDKEMYKNAKEEIEFMVYKNLHILPRYLETINGS